jgi:beta-galactosidase/beta-glucuronidase
MDLGGSWTLRDTKGEHSVAMAIPGDGITALQAAGVIPDPYHGRNEYTCRWIADRDWTIARDFTLDDPNVVLVIDGLDCVAEVRVNGVLVLSADNAFRVHRAGLSAAAKTGRNRIEILFRSNPREADRRQAAQPAYVPYTKANSPIPNPNMLRKAQCDFGWDWNIALVGINDTAEAVAITVELRRITPSGAVMGSETRTLAVPSGRCRSEPLETVSPGEILSWSYSASDGSAGEDLWAPSPWKSYDLQPPEIEMEVERQGTDWSIALTCQAPAFFVALECDRPGRFDRNAFSLLPGQAVRVMFTPQESVSALADASGPDFILRNLHTATYGPPP